MKQITGSPLGLSTSQAAQALGVSLGTIRRWSDMGYLQSYRTPGASAGSVRTRSTSSSGPWNSRPPRPWPSAGPADSDGAEARASSAGTRLVDPALHVELDVEVGHVGVAILDALTGQQGGQDLHVAGIDL